MFEYAIPVFGGEAGSVQLDADNIRNRLGICEVGHGGAVFGTVIFVPVLHEQAFDLIPLIL